MNGKTRLVDIPHMVALSWDQGLCLYRPQAQLIKLVSDPMWWSLPGTEYEAATQQAKMMTHSDLTSADKVKPSQLVSGVLTFVLNYSMGK